eukprot:Platyproteum_vivax@DN14471_c0_g1_i1.p1
MTNNFASKPTVRKLSAEATELYNRLLVTPAGLDINKVKTQKGAQKEQLVKLINELAAAGRVQILKDENNAHKVQAVPAEVADKLAKLSTDEKFVLQTIKDADRHGIWSRDIKNKTLLSDNTVNRALKTLVAGRMIKQVKAAGQTSRRIYMLYELEPSKEISGGSFYKDGEFDEELVEGVKKVVLSFLQKPHTPSEIVEYVGTSSVSSIHLGESEIAVVLRVLELDDYVTWNYQPASSEVLYHLNNPTVTEIEDVGSVPCVSCPVFNECSTETGAKVNPKTCQYFTDWLTVQYSQEEDAEMDAQQDD